MQEVANGLSVGMPSETWQAGGEQQRGGVTEGGAGKKRERDKEGMAEGPQGHSKKKTRSIMVETQYKNTEFMT